MLDRSEAMKLSTFTVSITPFSAEGGLDEDTLRQHLRRLGAAGMGVYVGGSGSGEGLTLSRDETFRLYRVAAEELSGKVPVRAMGIEPRTAGEMIELARIAAEAKLDAMQVYSVVAPGATGPEIEAFYADTLSGIKLPAVISTHHAVGYMVSPETVANIVDRFPSVVGVNCTRAGVRLIDLIGKKVAVQVADTLSIWVNLSIGGHGFLSQEGNFVPRLCVSIIRHFRAGDFAKAAAAYAMLMRVVDVNTRLFGGMKGIKFALGELGLPGGHPRRPRLPLTDAERDAVRRGLKIIDHASIEAAAGAA